MDTFFYSMARTMIEKRINDFPLLKIEQVIDWKKIASIFDNGTAKKTTNVGRPAYNSVKMFKAVLLGQWYNISDAALELSLMKQIDFLVFCGFNETELPDSTTLCRFRNFLINQGILPTLLYEINHQLEANNLKIKNGTIGIVDATIIETAATKQAKVYEIYENGEKIKSNPCKDKDARWTKKGDKFYLGYRQHTRVDGEGYVEKLYATPANSIDIVNFEPLVEDLTLGTMVFADKGYASDTNRKILKDRGLLDGIMDKAQKNKPLSDKQLKRNAILSKIRYIVERTFGTQHRIFCGKRARYFGLKKVEGQSFLKAICMNLLKAANKMILNYCP